MMYDITCSKFSWWAKYWASFSLWNQNEDFRFTVCEVHLSVAQFQWAGAPLPPEAGPDECSGSEANQ